MRRLLTLALLGIFGIAGLSYSQEIPDGLKVIMDQLQNNPDAYLGFNMAKKDGFIASEVQFKNWFVGLPIEFYQFKDVAIDNATNESRMVDLIESKNIWRIPIRIDNKYKYYVMVFYGDSKFQVVGNGENVLGFNTWDKIRKKYAENSGVKPIVISSRYHSFVHFPHIKNNNSILHIKDDKWKDELSLQTSGSLDSLDENYKIIKFMKKNKKKTKEESQKYYRNMPGKLLKMPGGTK